MSELNPPEVPDPPSPVTTQHQATEYESIIEDLKGEIKRLRQDSAGDKRKHDEEIGALHETIDEFREEIDKFKKSVEKARQRPSQTLVPPPPPPPDETAEPTSVKGTSDIPTGSARRMGWRRAW